MAIPQWLKRILDHHQIPYQERQHPPAFSSSHLAHAEHVSGRRVVKCVFLSGRGRPVTVVLPASARLELARVQEVLGEPELRFAAEGEIANWFKGCQPGAVPPFRLRADQCILMDRSLARLGDILFPAGTSEDAVLVRFRDWYRAVRPGVGRFAADEHPADGHASPTVLVVEDEADTNELLCGLLERQGLACRGVQAGKQALVLAAEQKPAAILLDLMLPDVSGFEVYEQLCRSGPLKRIPVIVVTALDDEASRQRSRQLGADAYLTKPFMPKQLVQEVESLLADARA
jgi:Ala-tRNA(Pro) deacylase